MSAPFTIHQRPGELDRLSEALLQSFSRPVSKPLYRGSVWTIILTAVTLGLWPLWKSVRWMRDFAAVREQRLWHLAEWFRVNRQDTDATQLQALASAIQPNAGIASAMRALTIISLISATTQHGPVYHYLYQLPTTEHERTFAGLICLTSLLLVVQLWVHQRQFHRYLAALNPLLARHHLAAIRDTSLLSFNLLDWIGGAVLASQGAAWPIFTIVSIGLFRGYVRRSLRVHAQIGDRVRDLLQADAPPVRLPLRSDFLDRCPNEKCGAILKNEADFCGRCGTQISPKR